MLVLNSALLTFEAYAFKPLKFESIIKCQDAEATTWLTKTSEVRGRRSGSIAGWTGPSSLQARAALAAALPNEEYPLVALKVC